MIDFYQFPGTCSQGVYVALEETGTPYRPHLVNLLDGSSHQPAYLAVNPAGQVPALGLEDGQVLTEAGAILFWLGETHPQAGLLPTAPLERARLLETLSFISYSLHGTAGNIWKPEKLTDDPTSAPALKSHAIRRYLAALAILEARLGDKPWLLGEKFSLADCHLLPFWHWAKRWKLDLAALPRLNAWHARMLARPAVERVLAAEKADLKALLGK